jgi:ATP-dependent Clp protease protease subunit
MIGYYNRAKDRWQAGRQFGKAVMFHADDKKIAVFEVFGEIDSDMADSFCRDWNETRHADEVVVLIDSGGGTISAGIKMMEAMTSDRRPITTICVGIAASLAGCIFLCGKRREMTQDSALMIHNAHRGGDENDPQCIRYSEVIAEMISSSCDADVETVAEWMAVETWINTAHALRLGLCHGINFDAKARIGVDTRLCNQPLPLDADECQPREVDQLLAEANDIDARRWLRAELARQERRKPIVVPDIPAHLRGKIQWCGGFTTDSVREKLRAAVAEDVRAGRSALSPKAEHYRGLLTAFERADAIRAETDRQRRAKA